MRFYVNLWIHETHHLVAATEEDKQAYPDTQEPQRTYYAAVTRADRLIGTVLDTLKELGLERNTIVVFSSDNGPEDTHPNPGDKFYYSVGDTRGLLMTEDGQRVELYDLVKDRAQQDNLATEQPRQVASMIEALRAWKETLPPSPEPPAAVQSPAPRSQPAPDRARAFTRWDPDKDGVLTLEEYRTGLTRPTNAETRFRNFDKDGDGKLTRDEFVTPGSK